MRHAHSRRTTSLHNMTQEQATMSLGWPGAEQRGLLDMTYVFHWQRCIYVEQLPQQCLLALWRPLAPEGCGVEQYETLDGLRVLGSQVHT
jgi:hypothetical protein